MHVIVLHTKIIWAKLQNTPQLIYMCREALKIEA